MNRTTVLKVLVLCLLAVSLLLFVIRLGRVVLRILQAKPEPAYPRKRFGQRCWNFFWEVLCQANVIQARPLAGLAHAFLLWGFGAFLFAEIDHFTALFGHPLLDRDSTAGVFYFWFVFLFAFCCTISIVGLAFRRHIVKSDWLDPITTETSLTLGLILLVVLTLLPPWWLEEASMIGQSFWWLHTLALLVLIPLIPHAKNLHALLSPVALFLKRPGFSQIPALRDWKDEGIANGLGITRLTALQAYSCVECGRCTERCPAYNTGKELDPRLIALGLNYYLDEYGPHSATPILQGAISAKAIFECTTCGACETACPVGIQPLAMIVGLRRGAVNTHAWHDENGSRLVQNLKDRGNAMGAPESERAHFITGQALPVFDGSQEYCLWLGCMGAYDPQGRATIESFVEIMRYLGTSFGVLRKEHCTGDPVRRLGHDALVTELAEANLKLLRQSSVTKIVSICPHCVRTMAEDWNQLRAPVPGQEALPFDATIEHHSEFLARYADHLPVLENGPKVAFHDPCYLGRYRGVYDDPRTVLARTARLVEAPRTREKSFCCGAGGGLVFLGEETGQRISHERADELLATNADVVATACPFCTAVFREAVADAPGDEQAVQFLDIAQIVERQIRS